ncbi:FMN-binding negative transcriptional regulator [Flavobacterium difficile]|uniref:FMN-binding negative transcriptional regulator n=1 Tax=Flavobacterium difficile TaxID=2709659 RepID=A0ABX0I8R4_9FLAO|nr:FMN-binding negative transcriptional regulator [Flavobacterium difficile]NHM02555.1 FMN-binding negative transcriptional regulator [Flavobacterium difficile]
MYQYSYFKENDKEIILDFIEKYPFAFLTGSFISGEQVATQIPLVLEVRNEELYLQGHIMRNTDHHKAFIENPNCLVVFSGPSAYVSATWYNSPQSGSTWNYMSVHVKGKMNFMTNEGLATLMKKFTLKFENNDMESPTIFDNLPKEYLNKYMPAIVGFEIKVETIDNTFKLSQNKDEESYTSIVSKLEELGGNNLLIAEEMKLRKAELFSKNKER